jgi:hypothetical protein
MRVRVEGLRDGSVEWDTDKFEADQPPPQMSLGPMVTAGWGVLDTEWLTASLVGFQDGVAVYRSHE